MIDFPSSKVGPIPNKLTRRSNLSSRDRLHPVADEVVVDEDDEIDREGDMGDLTAGDMIRAGERRLLTELLGGGVGGVVPEGEDIVKVMQEQTSIGYF